MSRFASQIGMIGAVLISALALDKAAAQPQPQPEYAPAEQAQPLAETHWVGRVVWSDREASDNDNWTLYFRSDGVLVYTTNGASHDDGAWRQHNRLVAFETGEPSSGQVGRVHGDVMEGAAYNQDGLQGAWTFQRETAQIYACPSNMVALRGTAAALVCMCPQNIAMTTVWGEPSSYTDDSDICTAAVHAGIITAAAGGTVTVTPRAGQDSYQGSTANGVTTLPYGSWTGSYTVTEGKRAKRR
ncbi:MAG: LCCL domain-containing protein [Vitreimonas sp.]